MLRVRRDHAILVIGGELGKIRLVLGTQKPTLPEAVDILLAHEGVHGFTSPANMRMIIDQLRRARVFDVMLLARDNEVLDHPDLVAFLEAFKRARIAVRFTTSAVSAVTKMWPQISDLVCGFTFVANTAKDVLVAANYLSLSGVPLHRVKLTYELGECTRKEFIAYMLAAYARGFRVKLTSPRNLTTVPYDWWDDEVVRLANAGKLPPVSIDTLLAADADFGRRSFTVRTPDYSMFIDAVDMTFGRTEESSQLPFTPSWLSQYSDL